MPNSMAHLREDSLPLEMPAWKSTASLICAVLLALLFIISGVWKITDPIRAATLMTQALVPHALSLPAALGFGIGETFAGVLLLAPRFRRWGAWLSALMLVAFMAYFAVFYNRLRGADCSCFPWVERAVGPMFFITDGLMLAMALAAGWWARPGRGVKQALLVLAAVSVFAGASLGIHTYRAQGIEAPLSIQVDGQPFPLHSGRVFLYFFDPECLHCDLAAREMSKYRWGDTRVVVIPTAQPQFTGQFLESTGLRALVSNDLETLRKTFSFVSSPYAVALESGRQKAAITHFEGGRMERTLRELGFIQ